MNDPLNQSQPDGQDNDLSQYLQMYVDETEEQLDDLVETMLALEESSDNLDLLVNAFRLLHSMKGAAGMMGFDQITVLTHHLESRFERLRSGRLQLDRVTMNLTLRSIDFLKQCNERLRHGDELATPDLLLMELRQLEDLAEKEVVVEERVSDSPSDSRAREIEVVGRAEQLPSPAVVDPADSEAAGTYRHLVVIFDEAMVANAELLQRVVARVETFGRVEATRPSLDQVDEADLPRQLDVIVFTDVDLDRMADGMKMECVAALEIRVPRDESPRRYCASIIKRPQGWQIAGRFGVYGPGNASEVSADTRPVAKVVDETASNKKSWRRKWPSLRWPKARTAKQWVLRLQRPGCKRRCEWTSIVWMN